jgi:hypothetical protein
VNAHIFTVKDKTGREIRLTMAQWRHIASEHPDVNDVDAMRQTLAAPALVRRASTTRTSAGITASASSGSASCSSRQGI